MNTRLYLSGIVVALIGVGLFASNVPVSSRALASYNDEQGEAKRSAHAEESLEALFAEDEHVEDDHVGHGHEGQNLERKLSDAQGVSEAFCWGHNVPEAQCALCQGSQIAELAPGQGMKVRLAAKDVAEKAGIRISAPVRIMRAEGNRIPGRTVFDRKQIANMTALAPGVVRKVYVQPGAKVSKGDLLVEIAIPEVAALKADFIAAQARQIQAEATYQREKDLLARGISSRQEFQLAEAEFLASRSTTERYQHQLLNFGLSETDLKQLARLNKVGANVSLRAPFAGVVTELQTNTGETVDAGSPLVKVANIDSLWVEVDIPESKIYQAETGAEVAARFDGLPDAVFRGQLFQVGAALDERSRTLKALAEVPNPGHRLKVGMFGSVSILSSESTMHLAIPAEAVQSIDGQNYLFIQEEADLFELRRVTTGADQDGLVMVIAGLQPGDKVVSGQGFALKSEVLKARLGASCADH